MEKGNNSKIKKQVSVGVVCYDVDKRTKNKISIKSPCYDLE